MKEKSTQQINNEREIDIIVVGKGGGGVANQNLVSS